MDISVYKTTMAEILMLLTLSAPLAAYAAEPATTWNFEVSLDNKPIGYHSFELATVGDKKVLSSAADFEVRFLFFTAFRYQHRSREVWQDNCLRSIDARTDSNGKEFEVRGATNEGRFVLKSPQMPAPVDECVASFAYWDRELLGRDRLLNSQTGEYLDVTIEARPGRTVPVGDTEVPAEILHIAARGVDIELSYAADSGEWLGLRSTLNNGRTLVYKRDESDLDRTARIAAAHSSGVTP